MWLARLQVLAIGETVEEVNDSGFLGSTPTLRTQLMADDSMLQVRLQPAMHCAQQKLLGRSAVNAWAFGCSHMPEINGMRCTGTWCRPAPHQSRQASQ